MLDTLELAPLLIDMFCPIDIVELIYTTKDSRNKHPPIWIFTNEESFDSTYWEFLVKAELKLFSLIGYLNLHYVSLRFAPEPKLVVYYQSKLIYRRANCAIKNEHL